MNFFQTLLTDSWEFTKKVKEVSGSGVIRTSCSSGRGDSYFVGNVLITDTDIKDEYVVFRYQ